MLNPSDMAKSLTTQSARADPLQLLCGHSNIVIHLLHCRICIDRQQPYTGLLPQYVWMWHHLDLVQGGGRCRGTVFIPVSVEHTGKPKRYDNGIWSRRQWEKSLCLQQMSRHSALSIRYEEMSPHVQCCARILTRRRCTSYDSSCHLRRICVTIMPSCDVPLCMRQSNRAQQQPSRHSTPTFMTVEVAEGSIKRLGYFAGGIIICHDALVLYDPNIGSEAA